MTETNQNDLIKAYSILKSLRSNIDKVNMANIEESFIMEFHNALDKLAGIIDVDEFRIPDSEIAPIIVSRAPVTYGGGGHSGGTATYSKEKYVKKLYFLMKIDSVLNYFEIITSEKPKRIGIRTPEE